MSTTGNNEETARRTLALFFGDQDTVTPEEVFERAARTGKPKATNDHWFHNRTWILRQFGLVQADKNIVDGRMRTVRLRLTSAGKDMLNKVSGAIPESAAPPVALSVPYLEEARVRTVTLQSITDDVDEFNRQNPSWEIELIPRRIQKESPMRQR